MLKILVIFGLFVVLPSNYAQNSCSNPDGVRGVCISLGDCQEFLDRFAADKGFRRYIQISNRACGQPSPIVCCPRQRQVQPPTPTQTTATAPPPPPPRPFGNSNVNLPSPGDQCGKSGSTFKKIVGGEPAKLGGWPWITLLGYTDSFGTRSFKCGGALITPKHVLTAAHCIRTDLTHVRLGEHNLNNETETTYYDINVNQIIKHPNYNSKDGHSDIAMLRLETAAPHTDLVHPICLPITDELRTKSYVNTSPFVAGWGKTQEGGQSSTILQQIQVPVHPNSLCIDRYQKKNRLISAQQFDSAVICAGVLAGGKDTCQGDSGGPLMVPVRINQLPYYYLIGVVSYGIGCARPEIPGVYTNIPYFMNWIEEQLAAYP